MMEHKTVDYVAIGKRIRESRTKQDITQQALAKKAGITVQFLSNVENANAKASLTTIVKIANALETGVDALLCDNLTDCRPVFEGQLAMLVSNCSESELRLIYAQAKGLVEELKNTDILKKQFDENDSSE